MEDCMLTTYDNPIDPFENFDAWYKEDLRLGHDCCGLLARESAISEIFGEEINNQYIDDAIDRIIKREPMIYKKVTKIN